MDKLNRIGFNLGAVNNNLDRGAKKQEKEQAPAQEETKHHVECKNVDPDKLMDAMKQQGVHNFNHVMASGKVGSKSISETVDNFTKAVTPEMHTKLTEKVKNVFAQEFPNAKMDKEVIAEVVDEIIFGALSV